MAAPANELQAVIFETLRDDTAVAAYVAGRVYDRAPTASDQYPFITIGDGDEVTDDAECIDASDHALDLHVWSTWQGGHKESKAIAHAIKKALHDQSFDLPTHALIEIRVASIRYMRDPDGITSHGVVSVEAMVEDKT